MSLLEVETPPPALSLQCPTCGAGDQTGPECRRCRSDLRLLVRVESQRQAETAVLTRALAEHRWADSLASAQFIHTLRADADSFRLLAVCQLLNRQLDAARDTFSQCGRVVAQSG